MKITKDMKKSENVNVFNFMIFMSFMVKLF